MKNHKTNDVRLGVTERIFWYTCAGDKSHHIGGALVIKRA